uniref:Uncharacterized protein n=1 Tax=Eptatretus burgeri TaxID=7764 RepID=A0A8C4NBS3_EPTBU
MIVMPVNIFCYAFRIKGDLTYNYRGPRTKDDIIDFANRVAGPAVRLLTSSALFDHTRQRQPVFFLYVGSDAPLKEVYIEIAKQLVVKTQFFATSQNILPQDIQPRGDPTILVFKDDTWFHYDEAEDGDLKAWVTQELFPSFLEINSYSLYDLSESGKF